MNKKKGFTLVEVLVSITIFLITFLAIASSITLAVNKVKKYEEYQYIENVCLDIDKIYDKEGYEGLVKYYSFNGLTDNKSSGKFYLDKNYKFMTEEDKYCFTYTYSKTEDDVSLIITVTEETKNYIIIKDLEYGHSKYDDTKTDTIDNDTTQDENN